jgi:hypothetical protein
MGGINRLTKAAPMTVQHKRMLSNLAFAIHNKESFSFSKQVDHPLAPMNKKDLSERDICTKFITPAIQAAGWQQHQFPRGGEADEWPCSGPGENCNPD